MDKTQAELLVIRHMQAHGLHGWKFKWSKSNSRLGSCHYSTKTIKLSIYYLHLQDAEIIDTILHEIAHALVGRGHRHGHVWKAKAREIGARPKACASVGASTKPPLYKLHCHKCGYARSFFRKVRRKYSCGKCCPGRWNPDYILVPFPAPVLKDIVVNS